METESYKPHFWPRGNIFSCEVILGIRNLLNLIFWEDIFTNEIEAGKISWIFSVSAFDPWNTLLKPISLLIRDLLSWEEIWKQGFCWCILYKGELNKEAVAFATVLNFSKCGWRTRGWAERSGKKVARYIGNKRRKAFWHIWNYKDMRAQLTNYWAQIFVEEE